MSEKGHYLQYGIIRSSPKLQIDLIMLNTLTHARSWLNLSVLEVYMQKLLPDPYVLFIVTAVMFFHGSKIQTVILCRIL